MLRSSGDDQAFKPSVQLFRTWNYSHQPPRQTQVFSEMHHLPIPQKLQANIEYCFYESGHMVYAKDASLRQLHDNVADFIRRTAHTAP